MNRAKRNLLISLVIAAIAGAYFLSRSENPTKSSKPSPIDSPPPQAAQTTEPQPNFHQEAQQAEQTPTSSAPIDFVSKGEAAKHLPPDLVEQMNMPPPELPEEMQPQIHAEPQKLPEEFQRQLNEPPPELPDDLKRQLEQPRRVVEDIRGEIVTPPDAE